MVPLAAVTKIRIPPRPEFTPCASTITALPNQRRRGSRLQRGQAMAAMEEVFAANMPRERGYRLPGHVVQEKKAQQGVPASAVFAFSVLFVFLILAALSKSGRFLQRPAQHSVAVFGAFFVLWLRRMLLLPFSPATWWQIEATFTLKSVWSC